MESIRGAIEDAGVPAEHVDTMCRLVRAAPLLGCASGDGSSSKPLPLQGVSRSGGDYLLALQQPAECWLHRASELDDLIPPGARLRVVTDAKSGTLRLWYTPPVAAVKREPRAAAASPAPPPPPPSPPRRPAPARRRTALSVRSATSKPSGARSNAYRQMKRQLESKKAGVAKPAGRRRSPAYRLRD